MSEQKADPAALRRRNRYVAEAILDNSALRNALDDTQAQQLIDWGLARLTAFVARTETLPDEEATPLMEEAVTAVSRVMRQVNELVEHPTTPLEPSEAQTRNALGALSKQLALWQSLALPTADELQTIAQREAADQHTPAETFDSLMAVLETAPAPTAPAPAEPKVEAAAEPKVEAAAVAEPEAEAETTPAPPAESTETESTWQNLLGWLRGRS